MIGFEVKVNDQIIEVALEEGVASVILNRIKIKKQEIYLEISGLNTENQESHKWLSEDLKVGDSINIWVKEIAQPSTSETKEPMPEEIQNANRVKHFHKLQKELKEKGLI